MFVFFHASKALYSCDHGILINKIRKTGLGKNNIKLITSYFKDRNNFNVDGVSNILELVMEPSWGRPS